MAKFNRTRFSPDAMKTDHFPIGRNGLIRKNKFTTLIAALLLSACFTACNKTDTAKTTPATAEVMTYSGSFELAYKKSMNQDPACFIDLTNGKVYRVSEAAAHAKEIDLLWGVRTVVPSQHFLLSPLSNALDPLPTGSDVWNVTNLFTEWPIRNATEMTRAFTGVGNFNDIQTNAQFDTYVSNISMSQNTADFNALSTQVQHAFWFDATEHNDIKYQSIMYITNANDAAGTASFILKVRKM
jgi:hypothetical protein